jgi:carboxyl-terminal processing protease
LVQRFPPRENGEDLVKIVRQRVEVPGPETVDHEDAIVLRLASLEPGAAEAVREAISAEGAAGRALLLDLRGNSDGSYDEATRLISLFVPEETIGTIEGREGGQRELRTDGKAVDGERILGILVDRGTAGPAELVVAALRLRADASIIGGKTFGRAKLQQFLPLNDGGYLRLSIARCVGPDGKSWDQEGFDPDHALTSEDSDPVDRAVELLKSPPDKEPAA